MDKTGLSVSSSLTGRLGRNEEQQEAIMYSKETLCKKITDLYPDIGKCGIDITVEYGKDKNIWVVDLKKGTHELKHHLEMSDAEACMAGRQCVSLGLEIAQLKKNIEGLQY